MPAFDLPAEDMTNLVAHLRALAPMSRTAAPVVVRTQVQLTTGETIEGQILNQGPLDLQLRSDDKQIHLLRKTGDRYREVTSQTDWPTYNGDPERQPLHKAHANRQNQRRAPGAPLDLPDAERRRTIENTPLVVEGIMYVVQRERMLGARRGHRPR